MFEDVKTQTNVKDSVVTLVQGIVGRIQAAGSDRAQLAKVAEDLSANAAAAADAVVTGTSAEEATEADRGIGRAANDALVRSPSRAARGQSE